jgi:hypothetical protein
MSEGAGGMAAISVGISWWVLLIVVGILAFGGWKLAKLLWVIFR